MITSCVAWNAQDTRRGGVTTMGRRTRTMCLKSLTNPKRFKAVAVQAQVARYRRYTEAKSRIPLNLPPREYEAAVKKLAKRYKV